MAKTKNSNTTVADKTVVNICNKYGERWIDKSLLTGYKIGIVDDEGEHDVRTFENMWDAINYFNR